MSHVLSATCETSAGSRREDVRDQAQLVRSPSRARDNGTLPSEMIRALTRSYECRWGAPAVDRVDTAIFARSYFMRCMQCSYCGDSCCSWGADIDAHTVARLEERAGDVVRYTGVPRNGFWTNEWTPDAEVPGGRYTRTRVESGSCVFRNKRGRGCMLHSYALERGLDYHLLKPMVCSLFPVTFDEGLLHPSSEILDRSLQCIDDGPTLYRGVRGEIGGYFGQEVVAELDALERGETLAEPATAK